MHGQKKRRKRSLQGAFEIEGMRFLWSLLSEPQKTSEGYKGVCMSVQTEGGQHRELLLEYPMPAKTTGNGSVQLPQRPPISAKEVERDTRRAIRAGWDMNSRGKVFLFEVPEAAKRTVV